MSVTFMMGRCGADDVGDFGGNDCIPNKAAISLITRKMILRP